MKRGEAQQEGKVERRETTVDGNEKEVTGQLRKMNGKEARREGRARQNGRLFISIPFPYK